MKANTILDTIGNTPHVRIHRLFAGLAPQDEVWLKLEPAKPGRSNKHRLGPPRPEEAQDGGALAEALEEPGEGGGVDAVHGAAWADEWVEAEDGLVRVFAGEAADEVDLGADGPDGAGR